MDLTRTCFNALKIFDKKTSGGAPSLQKNLLLKNGNISNK